MELNPKLLEELRYWIQEREAVRVNKEVHGRPRPWSEDPIFQNWRFCNVRRENDKVTRWFKKNWRNEKYWDEPNFVAAIILGRTINWPDTLAHIGFPHVWDGEVYLQMLDDLQNRGDKVYTGAYMITAGPTGVRKNLWVLGNAETYFQQPPVMTNTLEETWRNVQAYPCVGPFIAGQVVADLKQTKHLADAADWWSWAALGPGSRRGLNRLWDRPIDAKMDQNDGLRKMQEVAFHLKDFKLCLQDVQNCLCEFDKYQRVKLGQGKPRSSYQGA